MKFIGGKSSVTGALIRMNCAERAVQSVREIRASFLKKCVKVIVRIRENSLLFQ